MTARVGVVLFPGSNRDIDAVNALRIAGAEPVVLWHVSVDLAGVSGILIPGGFAYGDYLRAGVIARFSPVMRAAATSAACTVISTRRPTRTDDTPAMPRCGRLFSTARPCGSRIPGFGMTLTAKR